MTIDEVFGLGVPKVIGPASAKERAVQAVSFYKGQFKEELQCMIWLALDRLTKKGTIEEYQFDRGVVDGLCSIVEWFNRQQGILNNKEEE